MTGNFNPPNWSAIGKSSNDRPVPHQTSNTMFNVSESPVNQYCNDIDGNQLFEGDLVVAIDIEDLENGPKRGKLLRVTSCSEPVSNFVEFEGYAFYGHRVLKVIQ